jgi:hypothetical protein
MCAQLYRQIPPGTLEQAAAAAVIYERYLASQAPRHINVPETGRVPLAHVIRDLLEACPVSLRDSTRLMDPNRRVAERHSRRGADLHARRAVRRRGAARVRARLCSQRPRLAGPTPMVRKKTSSPGEQETPEGMLDRFLFTDDEEVPHAGAAICGTGSRALTPSGLRSLRRSFCSTIPALCRRCSWPRFVHLSGPTRRSLTTARPPLQALQREVLR